MTDNAVVKVPEKSLAVSKKDGHGCLITMLGRVKNKHLRIGRPLELVKQYLPQSPSGPSSELFLAFTRLENLRHATGRFARIKGMLHGSEDGFPKPPRILESEWPDLIHDAHWKGWIPVADEVLVTQVAPIAKRWLNGVLSLCLRTRISCPAGYQHFQLMFNHHAGSVNWIHLFGSSSPAWRCRLRRVGTRTHTPTGDG